MSGNDTTTGIARSFRSSSSPDLWIPYILIGVACVTFLAIHFWCYHKRNRERYLRKRDEKRVKSGLMERRRITTLMLARYQSDLGISKRERDIDLTKLFYDNRIDIVFDESEDFSTSISSNHQPMHNFPPGADTEVSITGTASVAASESSSSARSKSIASSQTWPLVTERKYTLYNAHEGGGKDNKAIETNEENSCTIISNVNVSATTDVQQSQSSVDASIQHRGTNKTNCLGNSLQKITENTPTHDQQQVPQTVVLKAYTSPTSYPSVFYTSLNTIRSTHASFLSAFKAKHKRRRHEASSKPNSQKGTNESTGFKWAEFSRLYKPEKEVSDSSVIFNAGSHSNFYSLVGGEQFNCSERKLENSGCVLTETEVFPFAEGGLAYGSFSDNFGKENIQMVQLSEFDRDQLSNVPGYSSQRCSTGVHLGSSEAEKASSPVSPTIGVHNMGSSISTPNRGHQQNIVIPFTEKSRLNIISKNPAKIRTSAYGNTQTQFWLPRQRPRPLTKMKYIDKQNSFPELFVPQCENHCNSTHTHPAHLSSISETALSTSNMPATRLLFNPDNPEVPESRVAANADGGNICLFNDNDAPKIAENISGTVSNYELSTATVGGQNRGLVIHNAKRKLEIKSE